MRKNLRSLRKSEVDDYVMVFDEDDCERMAQSAISTAEGVEIVDY